MEIQLVDTRNVIAAEITTTKPVYRSSLAYCKLFGPEENRKVGFIHSHIRDISLLI